MIVSNAGGLKDFVVNGRNGLVFSPEDIESLDMEYVRLTSEDGLRRRLAETALADVQNYSWEAIAARLTALYRTLIEGVNGRNA